VKRRVLNLVTALSLLVFAAVMALGVRSYWRWDSFPLGHGRWPWAGKVSVASYRGHLLWRCRPTETAPPFEPRYATGPLRDADPIWAMMRNRPSWWLGSFEFTTQASGPSARREFATPAWLFALLAGALPAGRLVAARRTRRRRRGGQCPACGYDLRATPGRCPECGTIASPPATP
jgi:hypothetical protein